MFEIKNMSKKYGDEFALNCVSMEIGNGLNFIIGASGSGKTTLLRIICGMEQSFEGEVFFCEQNMKELTERDRSYFYNNVFGFVWQDFNLLEDLTVLENIMLPQYLKKEINQKEVMKVLRELKIVELAKKKVGKLSGGQKQRVAIARELIKNPQVIIADEPTSALDEKSAKNTMDILRDISKKRTVIIVTHDTSLIDTKSKVYILDKGELISASNEEIKKKEKVTSGQRNKLSMSSSSKLAWQNIKSKWGRFSIAALSMLVAGILLLVTVSGAILDSSQAAFDELFATYGQSILDIDIVGSFMSAGGTAGSEQDEPSADVSQNISGLYDKYQKDERVSHIVFMQAYNDICILVNGKEYKIESSGSSPEVNELTEGTMPMGNENEVVIPNSFVKEMGMKEKEVLGNTITFEGTIYNWESGEPIPMPVKTTAKIVGVVDTTVKYDAASGEVMEYSVEDAFFFSKSATDEMRAQAKTEGSKTNFTIRTRSPEDLIAIKDELNAEGIVPLGRFELVEDMVRLSNQTGQQSEGAVLIIGILSVVVVLAVSLITALTRRREYAIYKVSGYGTGHLSIMVIFESIMVTFFASAIFITTSPLINMVTMKLWEVNILGEKMLATGVLLIIGMGMLFGVIEILVRATTKSSTSLKTGER